MELPAKNRTACKQKSLAWFKLLGLTRLNSGLNYRGYTFQIVFFFEHIFEQFQDIFLKIHPEKSLNRFFRHCLFFAIASFLYHFPEILSYAIRKQECRPLPNPQMERPPNLGGRKSHCEGNEVSGRRKGKRD